MSGVMKGVAVFLIVLGLILGGVGAGLMFVYVPGLVDDAEVPDDLDKHYFYGGYVSKMNTSSGTMDTVDFTADRHVTYEGEADGGNIYIRSAITAKKNATGDDFPDLASDTVFKVHPKDLSLYNVDIQGGSLAGYNRDIPESAGVNYVFPIPTEEEDYQIWSSDILNWTTAEYLGKEDRGGVECYAFKGFVPSKEGLNDPEVKGYEMPLPASLEALLGEGAAYAKFYLKGWEKAWVHPTTGSIIDYSKELRQYLYLDLPEVPEVIYPSDLMSKSGFTGNLVLFDQATGTFTEMEGITAVRMVEVTEADGYIYTANDTTDVYTPTGMKIDLISSAVQVMFNATDGTHAGMGRTGNYLFPPTGVEMKDYMIWDDGFGKELTAAYMGNKTIGGLNSYEYMIDVENETYLAGGYASMMMTYWVEPSTGIVLDVDKQVKNWRPMDARRLPLDTSLINKTMHLNTTITAVNPVSKEVDTMEIMAEQEIACPGYTDATFQVAKIEESVTKFVNGTAMGPASVARFGVNAVTMDYVYVDGWSTMNRTGQFTFPLGLMDEDGNVTESFMFYNSDLGSSFPAVLQGTEMVGELEVAEYLMQLADIPVPEDSVEMLLNKTLDIPGAEYYYACDYSYYGDVYTGTTIDIMRTMTITVVPPTYEYLWDNLGSQSVLEGVFLGENVTMTQTLVGAEAGEGTTALTITTDYEYTNGTAFMPQTVNEILIDIETHEMLLPNGTGMGIYYLFPTNPMDMAAYPMAYTFGGTTFMGAAMMGTEYAETVEYNFSAMELVDAEMFGAPAGVYANMTLEYNYLIHKVTGMVLDVNVMIMLENNSVNLTMDFSFYSDAMTQMYALGSNEFMKWAVSMMNVTLVDMEIELVEDEVMYNMGKAMVTAGGLMVADGLKPALDLHIMMNETTKATMLATAQGTLALLEQLEGLKTLQGLNQVLGLLNNKIAHVYYTQLEEEPEGYDYEGSVNYHGETAKEIDDGIALLGTSIPVTLYVVALMFIIIGIALLLMGGKKEEEPTEEEEEEEQTEDEEGEGEEGEGEE